MQTASIPGARRTSPVCTRRFAAPLAARHSPQGSFLLALAADSGCSNHLSFTPSLIPLLIPALRPALYPFRLLATQPPLGPLDLRVELLLLTCGVFLVPRAQQALILLLQSRALPLQQGHIHAQVSILFPQPLTRTLEILLVVLVVLHGCVEPGNLEARDLLPPFVRRCCSRRASRLRGGNLRRCGSSS
jgi:hypothetical protein